VIVQEETNDCKRRITMLRKALISVPIIIAVVLIATLAVPATAQELLAHGPIIVSHELGLGLDRGFDLTDPADVARLRAASCTDPNAKTLPQPWRPAPSPDDPRADGYCWQYGGDSNYHPANACTFSSSTCLDRCYKDEQTCADSCAATFQDSCETSGTQCEECQDRCRSRFNSCQSSCGG
jgi:hypothetical protein